MKYLSAFVLILTVACASTPAQRPTSVVPPVPATLAVKCQVNLVSVNLYCFDSCRSDGWDFGFAIAEKKDGLVCSCFKQVEEEEPVKRAVPNVSGTF